MENYCLKFKEKIPPTNYTHCNSTGDTGFVPCDISIHLNLSRTICYIQIGQRNNPSATVVLAKPLQLIVKWSQVICRVLKEMTSSTVQIEWKSQLLTQLRKRGVDVPHLRGINSNLPDSFITRLSECFAQETWVLTFQLMISKTNEVPNLRIQQNLQEVLSSQLPEYSTVHPTFQISLVLNIVNFNQMTIDYSIQQWNRNSEFDHPYCIALGKMAISQLKYMITMINTVKQMLPRNPCNDAAVKEMCEILEDLKLRMQKFDKLVMESSAELSFPLHNNEEKRHRSIVRELEKMSHLLSQVGEELLQSPPTLGWTGNTTLSDTVNNHCELLRMRLTKIFTIDRSVACKLLVIGECIESPMLIEEVFPIVISSVIETFENGSKLEHSLWMCLVLLSPQRQIEYLDFMAISGVVPLFRRLAKLQRLSCSSSGGIQTESEFFPQSPASQSRYCYESDVYSDLNEVASNQNGVLEIENYNNLQQSTSFEYFNTFVHNDGKQIQNKYYKAEHDYPDPIPHKTSMAGSACGNLSSPSNINYKEQKSSTVSKPAIKTTRRIPTCDEKIRAAVQRIESKLGQQFFMKPQIVMTGNTRRLEVQDVSMKEMNGSIHPVNRRRQEHSKSIDKAERSVRWESMQKQIKSVRNEFQKGAHERLVNRHTSCRESKKNGVAVVNDSSRGRNKIENQHSNKKRERTNGRSPINESPTKPLSKHTSVCIQLLPSRIEQHNIEARQLNKETNELKNFLGVANGSNISKKLLENTQLNSVDKIKSIDKTISLKPTVCGNNISSILTEQRKTVHEEVVQILKGLGLGVFNNDGKLTKKEEHEILCVPDPLTRNPQTPETTNTTLSETPQSVGNVRSVTRHPRASPSRRKQNWGTAVDLSEPLKPVSIKKKGKLKNGKRVLETASTTRINKTIVTKSPERRVMEKTAEQTDNEEVNSSFPLEIRRTNCKSGSERKVRKPKVLLRKKTQLFQTKQEDHIRREAMRTKRLSTQAREKERFLCEFKEQNEKLKKRGAERPTDVLMVTLSANTPVQSTSGVTPQDLIVKSQNQNLNKIICCNYSGNNSPYVDKTEVEDFMVRKRTSDFESLDPQNESLQQRLLSASEQNVNHHDPFEELIELNAVI